MATAFIGGLVLINRGIPQEHLVFLGADQLGDGRWRVNLSREMITMGISRVVPMHIDVSAGQMVRMPHFGIYWDHKKSVPAFSGGTLYAVSSIRFVSLACDCIEVEYEFPKQQ